jgi:hypothetical protein
MPAFLVRNRDHFMHAVESKPRISVAPMMDWIFIDGSPYLLINILQAIANQSISK